MGYYNHRPLIDINPKNSKELKEKIQLIKDEKKKFEILNLTQSLDTHHYNQRSMVRESINTSKKTLDAVIFIIKELQK